MFKPGDKVKVTKMWTLFANKDFSNREGIIVGPEPSIHTAWDVDLGYPDGILVFLESELTLIKGALPLLDKNISEKYDSIWYRSLFKNYRK